MKSLSQQVIVVTGAAGGFGQQFIKQLLEQEAHLILTDINKENLEKNSSEILKSIPNCKGKILGVFASDLSTKKGCEETYLNAKSISPQINILINNAGLINYGLFHEIPIEKWERLMQVNIMAVMYLSHSFMNYFVSKKEGHILNISSVSGYIPTSNGAPYSTSKFAVRGFGMALHGEAKQFGINVSNVYPFYSPTPLLQTKTDGSAKTQTIPKFLYDSPELIVSAAIKGLRKNKLHIYPGILSHLLYTLTKFFPIVANLSR
jgi:short-subunit dehydrogenase